MTMRGELHTHEQDFHKWQSTMSSLYQNSASIRNLRFALEHFFYTTYAVLIEN